jgi:hypothetical protein
MKRDFLGPAVLFAIATAVIIAVTTCARGAEQFNGVGVLCEEPSQILQIYDQMSVDDDGDDGWASALRTVDAINAHEPGACYHVYADGVLGQIVATKDYEFGRVYVREAVLHAILEGGRWVYLPTPRLYYTGGPLPLVSELPAWLAPAQYQSPTPPASAPIVPATTCPPNTEMHFSRCRPDCRFGPCLRKRLA